MEYCKDCGDEIKSREYVDNEGLCLLCRMDKFYKDNNLTDEDFKDMEDQDELD